MGDKINETEWLNTNQMTQIAEFIAKSIPGRNRVAIGVAKFKEKAKLARLEKPAIVIVASDTGAITDGEEMTLTSRIEEAADGIIAGREDKYDINDAPVLSFGINSDNGELGAVLITAIAENGALDMNAEEKLIKQIEEEISDFLAIYDEKRDASDDPFTEWCYGVFLGGCVFVVDTKDYSSVVAAVNAMMNAN